VALAIMFEDVKTEYPCSECSICDTYAEENLTFKNNTWALSSIDYVQFVNSTQTDYKNSFLEMIPKMKEKSLHCS
jgi:hypothetical protein